MVINLDVWARIIFEFIIAGSLMAGVCFWVAMGISVVSFFKRMFKEKDYSNLNE